MDSDIHVSLAAGLYDLSDTLVLSGADSGTNGHRVIYEAVSGIRARLSGGQRITGWVPIGGGVMAATLPRGLSFRQLYVGGVRATRARWPDRGFLKDGLVWNDASMTVTTGAPLPKAVRWKGVEFVANRHWQQHRIRISEVPITGPDGKSTISFEPDDAYNSFNAPGSTIAADQPYYFENARAFLDRPGEWYLDQAQGKLFYKPFPGQSLDDVRVPVLQTLVRLQGTDAQPVHDITFRGITFEHAGWTDPDRGGAAPVQATWLSTPDGARFMPAAVEVRGNGAHGIRFERDIFQHLGATGVAFFKTASELAVVESQFEDISAGAISVHSDPDRTDFATKGSRDIVIADNVISHTGVEYTGSVGIFLGYVENARVEHNELHDLPYTGISVGWGWTDKDNGSKNNRINFNHIYRVMTLHDDGGGIYTLSKQPGSTITGNYIHDLTRNAIAGTSGIGAIYLDNGSEGFVVRDNAIERVEERVHLNLLNMPGLQVPAKNNAIVDYTGMIATIAAQAGPRRN